MVDDRTNDLPQQWLSSPERHTLRRENTPYTKHGRDEKYRNVLTQPLRSVAKPRLNQTLESPLTNVTLIYNLVIASRYLYPSKINITIVISCVVH